MDHVENVGIEEIVEIIREFAKHGESGRSWVCKIRWRSGRQGETSIAKGNHEVVNNFLLFNF